MKRFLIMFSGLFLFGAIALFAAGDLEADARSGAYGECCQDDGEFETVSVTGTLELNADDRPELVANDGVYELMYPYYLSDGIEVKDGDTITVEGILMPGPRFEEGDENHLRVTKAIINGKEYDLNDAANGGRRAPMSRGMRGRAPSRGGMMGRQGSPQGWR